jgi:hypothetical protein
MRAVPVGLVLGLVTVLFAGCLSGPAPPAGPQAAADLPIYRAGAQRFFANTGTGTVLDGVLPNVGDLFGTLHKVGAQGAEPSIGVTSKGNIFFQAFEKTMKSSDQGKTWTRVQGPLTATTTSDPYLWVDPVTDRVFQVNMVSLACSHIAWSDDEGATWLGNPMDCGPVPVNDHIKLATGPWVGERQPLGTSPVYPNAVYYAYNKLVGAFMAVSLDGGATFPILTEMWSSDTTGCQSLHGAITAGPDGTVYVPGRCEPGPILAVSEDNGLTWRSQIVGETVGVPEQQKNPEVAVDTQNNAYFTWVGADNRTHLMVTKDHGRTFSVPVTVTPPAIGSSVWPSIVAGDPGRVGFMYIGTPDATQGPWEVDNSTRWHLYYTYTLNGLDPNPTFVTVQLTPDNDPIQRGTICVSSGACKNGNRNLLDFNDMVIDAEGRPFMGLADGCVLEACLVANGTPTDSRSREGLVAILQSGPSLYEKVGMLRPLGGNSAAAQTP